MKFIGQYIQQLIARFRNDVYLEDISTGTIASGGNLGLDSNNKIVKNTVSGSGGTASAIDVADESTDTSCFLTFVTGATGTQTLKTGSNLTFNSALGRLGISHDASDDVGSELIFFKSRSGGSAQDNDNIGVVKFDSYNDAGTPELIGFAEIVASVSDVTDGQEAGRLELKVAEFDGTKTTGLKLEGDTNANGEVDVTIGAGAASTTTVAGDLTVTSGVTLGGHTVNDIDISSEHVDSDEHLMTSAAIKNYVAANGGSVTVSDSTDNTSFPIVFHDESNNLHDDTGAFTYNPSTSTMVASIGNIFTITNQTLTVENAATFKGVFNVQNIQNNSDGGVINIKNTRAGNAGADGDECGEIRFGGTNTAGTPEEINYSRIISTIAESDDGDERGKLELQVTNDGTLRNGITMISSDTAEEVDVTIGNGAASLTTIAGDLQVNGNDIKDDDGTTCITFDSSGNTAIAGTLAVADIDVTSTAGQSLTITAGSFDNPVKIIGGDSKVFTAYSDTAGTNTIAVGALGDDSYFRNDEGSFKFYVADDTTVGAELTQAGNLTIAGDLKVTGNVIKDDDGFACITFDSSGNTIIGTLDGNNGGDLIVNRILVKDTDESPSAQVALVDNDDNNIAQLARIGSGANAHRGQLVLRDNATAKVQIKASGSSYINASSAKLGIGNNSPTKELDVTGDTNISGDLIVGGDVKITGNLKALGDVKILPSDFIADDVGRPLMIDDTGSDRFLESHSTAKMYASINVPVGTKATQVIIYGSGTSAVTVYEADVTSKSVTSKGTGNIGTLLNFTDITGDASNYVLIELDQTSSEEVYGGKLTIA